MENVPKEVGSTRNDSCIESIACPFCKEADFDLLGLKSHLLNGDCEGFNKLPIITRFFSR
jgi:hypothetical protein